MKVLILSPNPAQGQELRQDLLQKGLRPDQIVLKTGAATSDEVLRTVAQSSVNKVLAKDVPPGTLEAIVNKVGKTVQKACKFFRLGEKPGEIRFKNGTLHDVTSCDMLFAKA